MNTENKKHNEPCPTCELVMGYCGGENHPSCGYFHDGRPVSHTEFHKKQEGKK